MEPPTESAQPLATQDIGGTISQGCATMSKPLAATEPMPMLRLSTASMDHPALLGPMPIPSRWAARLPAPTPPCLVTLPPNYACTCVPRLLTPTLKMDTALKLAQEANTLIGRQTEHA